MNYRLGWMIALALFIGICWLFPPFHVVHLRQVRRPDSESAFDPAAFAQTFWQTKLLLAADRATEAGQLMAALDQDPKEARRRFGRSPGMTSTSYFFVKGSGVVNTIEKDGILVSLDDAGKSKLALKTALVFGNAVRD